MWQAASNRRRWSAGSGIVALTIWLVMTAQASSVSATGMRWDGRSTNPEQAQSEDLEEAKRLNREVGQLYDAGQYDEAIPLAKRVLTICEKTLGPNHPDVAGPLNYLALLYAAKGDYAKAEPLYQRALAITENGFSKASLLNNLALLYQRKGDYGRAEPLYQLVLFFKEKALGAEHPETAAALNNLATLYRDKGDYAKAEPLYQRALAIKEKALGAEHPETAAVLNNLAALYQDKGDYGRAEPLYQRALAISEKALGAEHSSTATFLNNLAALYRNKGDYAKAEPLFQRALWIKEKALGAEHPEMAAFLDNLALLYQRKGDYGRAEPLHQRALAIREKALGPNHPDVATSLNNLVLLYEAKGNIAKAIALLIRSNDISEHNLSLNLATGSERQRLAYLDTRLGETNASVSLHLQSAPNNPAARQLALLTVLRRKGRVFDATTDSVGALRRRLNPQDQTLLTQLSETHSRLATLSLRGPGETAPAQYLADIQRLTDQSEKLEAEISLRSAEFRAQFQAVKLNAIQAAIPRDARLVEFFSYYPINAKTMKGGAARYVAYILSNQGEPASVDLGEAQAIDNAVVVLREALRDPQRTDVKPLARALDEKVMQPVRKLLGETRRVFISPDGALNLIPFAALVDEQNRYLVEQYSFTYLTSGRDLLRLQTHLPSTQGPLVVADPDFGEPADKAEKREAATAARAFDFSQAYFTPLPGTAAEAQALKSILPQATVLTRDKATEGALKQAASPNILHIATHGFFLEDVMVGPPPTLGQRLLLQQTPFGEPVSGMKLENPLLRSGLGLAGANLRKSGDDDGILTALEVSGLNLWGTKLVVLSACDTGVGEVINGQGVYGLRRALVLAGSESQVMSLWPVSDQGTRELMVDYYKALQAGQGRSEGLRQVQLKMLADPRRQHPYYWASFIQSGEWANLEGKR